MAVTVTHTTAAVGVDSGDSLISKDAWNEGHTIAGVLAGQLLAYKAATTGDVTTTSATFVDADATNLAVTFTVPASGNVLVRLTGRAGFTASSTVSSIISWGLREGSSNIAGTAGSSIVARLQVATLNPYFACSIAWAITGLTPAASLTYKWAHAISNGTAGISAIAAQPAVMEVIALP